MVRSDVRFPTDASGGVVCSSTSSGRMGKQEEVEKTVRAEPVEA